MATPRILVIDTDEARTNALNLILEFLEYEPVIVPDCREWETRFEEAGSIDVVLLGPVDTEPRLLDVFRQVKVRDEHLPVVAMVTGEADPELAQEIDAGSVARVRVPIKHTELQNALQRVRMYRESRHLSGGSRQRRSLRRLPG